MSGINYISQAKSPNGNNRQAEVRLADKFMRDGFLPFISKSSSQPETDKGISKYFDWTPTISKNYVASLQASLTKSINVLAEQTSTRASIGTNLLNAFKWYTNYANMRLDDNINRERMAEFLKETLYDRPDPLYMATVPLLKAVASQILVDIIIVPVESMSIVYAASSALVNLKPRILGDKLANTASVLASKYLLLPDIYGFFAGAAQTPEVLRERVPELYRIPRTSIAEEVKARKLNNIGRRFFYEQPRLVNKQPGIYLKPLLQEILMGEDKFFTEEQYQAIKNYALRELGVNAVKKLENASGGSTENGNILLIVNTNSEMQALIMLYRSDVLSAQSKVVALEILNSYVSDAQKMLGPNFIPNEVTPATWKAFKDRVIGPVYELCATINDLNRTSDRYSTEEELLQFSPITPTSNTPTIMRNPLLNEYVDEYKDMFKNIYSKSFPESIRVHIDTLKKLANYISVNSKVSIKESGYNLIHLYQSIKQHREESNIDHPGEFEVSIRDKIIKLYAALSPSGVQREETKLKGNTLTPIFIASLRDRLSNIEKDLYFSTIEGRMSNKSSPSTVAATPTPTLGSETPARRSPDDRLDLT